MQGLFKFSRWMTSNDSNSDIKNNMSRLAKIRMTYPPVEDASSKFSINLKA